MEVQHQKLKSRMACTRDVQWPLVFSTCIFIWPTRTGDSAANRPFGVDVVYKCSGKLVGERTRRPSKMTLTEFLYTDDAVAVGTTRVHSSWKVLE